MTNSSFPPLKAVVADINNSLWDGGAAVIRPGAIESSAWHDNQYLLPYNGSVFSDSGLEFLWNNTTYGGNAGALDQAVIDLLDAMPTQVNDEKRYGPHWRITRVTMGAGTSNGSGARYQMFAPNRQNYPVLTSSRTVTFAAYMRATVNDIEVSAHDRLVVDGVEQANTPYLISSTWKHYSIEQQFNFGYLQFPIPNCFAVENDTLDIALPVVYTGGSSIAPHTKPIFSAANLAMTGTPYTVGYPADQTLYYFTDLTALNAAIPAGDRYENMPIMYANGSQNQWINSALVLARRDITLGVSRVVSDLSESVAIPQLLTLQPELTGVMYEELA